MKSGELDAMKRRADELVASYGRFELSTKMEEAVARIAELWSLDEIEQRLLRPRKTVATCNGIRAAKDFVAGAGPRELIKGAANAKKIAQFAKANGVAGVKAAANGAFKTGVTAVRSYPYPAIAGAIVTGLAVGSLSFVTKKELRNFNTRCYERRLEQLKIIDGAAA